MHVNSLCGIPGNNHHDTGVQDSDCSRTRFQECAQTDSCVHEASSSYMLPCVLPTSPQNDLVGLEGRRHCRRVLPFAFYLRTASFHCSHQSVPSQVLAETPSQCGEISRMACETKAPQLGKHWRWTHPIGTKK